MQPFNDKQNEQFTYFYSYSLHFFIAVGRIIQKRKQTLSKLSLRLEEPFDHKKGFLNNILFSIFVFQLSFSSTLSLLLKEPHIQKLAVI